MSHISAFIALCFTGAAAIPAAPHFFDHDASGSAAKFSQRYYLNDTAFAGPGSPILVIMGGEGSIEPSTGFFYPWVIDVLGPRFGALVIEPEHRFYGASLPFGAASFQSEHLRLLTPQQALRDAVALIRAVQAARNCTPRGAPHYCPVLTIGGSYPGYLSAMMRLVHPDVVDGAHAASAPMRFYSQQVDEFAYYEVITRSAERASPGCASAVSAALQQLATAPDAASLQSELGLCSAAAPGAAGLEALKEALNMVFMFSFAGLNMANYPPGPGTGLATACHLFRSAAPGAKTWAALRSFLQTWSGADTLASAVSRGVVGTPGRAVLPKCMQYLWAWRAPAGCFNLTAAAPAGPNSTVSCGDWSGCGAAQQGLSWDYQTCTLLVERIGTNGVSDMFPPRRWTLEWLNRHCAARFGVVPAPDALNELWRFDAAGLRAQGASRILFTNGLADGWSVGGFLDDVDPARELFALNMPNGAHHSDLRHTRPCPAPDDTEDVLEVRRRAAELMGGWLQSVRRDTPHDTPRGRAHA
jgi:pimeloyl-ACP methyl ester carboxylesterase